MKDKDVRFSVIIPAYNAEKTLGRAIESVMEQTWPADEIIVVDDGSQDRTAEVAKEYGEVVRLVQQTNAGVSAARNHGAEASTGDWLAFLDADDWYFPDRLRWHAEWIQEDSTLDFFTGDYEYRNEAGELIGTSMSSHASGRRMLEKASGAGRTVMESDEMEDFVADHFGDTHTLSVPRRLFEKAGGYPIGFKVCEDVHFLTRLCAVSRHVGVVCQSMAVYWVHSSSATRSDPVQAQQYNVETLLDLNRIANTMPRPIRQGVRRRLRAGRLNLGYSLIRAGRRNEAVRAVAPSLLEAPGWQSVRNALSILRG